MYSYTWYDNAESEGPDSMIKFFKYRASSEVSHDLTSGPRMGEFKYLGNASSTLRNLFASLPSDTPSIRDPIA